MATVGGATLDLHPSGPRAWKPNDANDWAQAVTTSVNTLSTTVTSAVSSAISTAVGNVSASYVTATGGSSARTLAARFAEQFNVKDFGALGDGTDDTSAIEAAIAACSAAGGGVVYFPRPTTHYKIARPIGVRDSSIRLVGEGKEVLTLRGTFEGPALDFSPLGTTIPTAPALVSGAGASLDFRSTAEQLYFNLRDAYGLELDGLAAFTFETYFRMDALGTDQRAILGGGGKRLSNETNRQSLQMYVWTDGVVYARLNVGGTERALNSGAFTLSAGVTYHLALTYDGSNVRLFAAEVGANSPARATVACTGTVSQISAEDVILGQIMSNWPESFGVFQDPSARLYSIRFSNSARYTGTHTAPNAGHTSDANTLLLINGTLSADGQFLVPEGATRQIGADATYIKARWLTYGDQISNSGVELMKISMPFGNPIFAATAVSCVYRHLYLDSCRYGVVLFNNCYLSKLEDIQVLLTSDNPRFAFAFMGAAGLLGIKDLQWLGGDYGIVCMNASGEMSGSVYGGSKKIGMILSSVGSGLATMKLSGVAITDEGMGSGVEACLAIDTMGAVCLSGSVLEILESAKPLVILAHSSASQPHNVAFEGVCFNNHASAAEIFSFLNTAPVAGGITVVSPNSPNSTPWSTPADLVRVSQNGKETVVLGVSGTQIPSNNLRGSVTISDANTTGTVTFATAEPDAAYYLAITPAAKSGTPDAASNRIESVAKLAASFTVTLEAAPGSGKSRTFDWVLIR